MEGVFSVEDYLKGITIKTVELLRPVAGDVVIVTVNGRLREEQAHNLGMSLRLLMPEGVRVGVCHDGMSIQVVRPEQEKKITFREFT